MTRLQKINHAALRYALIIPCVAAVLLGMFADGAFRYAEQKRIEREVMIIKMVTLPLKSLAEYRI